jgi:hypothetical protein
MSPRIVAPSATISPKKILYKLFNISVLGIIQ